MIYILSDGHYAIQPDQYSAAWDDKGSIKQLKVQTERGEKLTLPNKSGWSAWADFYGNGAREYPNCEIDPNNINSLHSYQL